MDSYALMPFDYFKHDDKHWCPKCGGSVVLDRKICTGKFVLFGKKCPSGEHFHHKCNSCGGTWCENILEKHKAQITETLALVLHECEELGMKEEEIINVWRENIIESVMDS